MYYTPINNASSTLAAAKPVGATTLTLFPGTGGKFGNPTPQNPVRITVESAADPALNTIYGVTGRSGDSLTGLTVLEGTTDRTYATGDLVEVRVTAGTVSDLATAIQTVSLTPGPAGATGLTGPQGPAGAAGATGAAGTKGDKGDTGATGSMGPAGPQGVPGNPGATGATGSTGSPGPAGVKGDTGATGPAGTSAIGAPVPGATATCVLYVNAAGNLANDAALKYDATNRALVMRDDIAGGLYRRLTFVSKDDSPAQDSRQRISYQRGYSYNTPFDVAAIDLGTDNGWRGNIRLMVGGDINGNSMKEAVFINTDGTVYFNYGLSYQGTAPIRLGQSNLENPAGRLEIKPTYNAQIGLNIQTNDYYGGGPTGIRPFIVTGNNATTVFGGIDNNKRWYIGLPDTLTAALSVQTLVTTEPAVVVRALMGQTASLQEWQAAGGTVLAKLRVDGSFKPAAMADSAAVNDSLYYSTTASKLVYKDPAGAVNPLY